MKSRLWYPQLDVYDTIRRMCVLLQSFGTRPSVERLCITDFYLATPPLLHGTSMQLEMRHAFKELKIQKLNKGFVSYPAPQILFHKMEPIQKQALLELSGKGLVSNEVLIAGKVQLTPLGYEKFPLETMTSPEEIKICLFLTSKFSAIEEVGNKQLRLQTGLRRSS